MNKEGLRSADELVRHKILDAIGDLSLSGYDIIGAFNAYNPGHFLNNQLLHALFSLPDCFDIL
jgi:UDP-3-O-[3-hydroxymyristoyl] N-acetylglucosamine deacetylase